MKQDTICALATANGIGAIGIIRVSGEDAIAIVNTIFEGRNLEKVNTHTVHYGYIFDKSQEPSKKSQSELEESRKQKAMKL